MPPFRQLVNNMLPNVDFPELLLEVAEMTALPDAFTHISGALTTMEDFAVSLCAVWLSEACNVGLTPVVKPDVPALTRVRLVQVDQGYFRAENISAGNGLFIEAQAKIDVARAWGGGLVASADGVRFTVPVKSLYSGHSPKYFGLRHKGATWLNVINDQVMGLGGVVVPGTLRDSLFILDAIHARDGGPKPEAVITGTASYSDIVFGLFAICGYQFSPRIADITDARLWRINAAADYGPLEPVSGHTIRLDRVRTHWGDMLRVAGSLTLGEVRGYDLIRMLSHDGKPTALGDAFAHYGRIFKTLHLLQYVSDEGYRRLIGAQLNVTEARHRIARKIFFGQRGELHQHYREGMEDQLGALGLALNAVVLFNTLYMDAAVKQLAADGFPVTDDLIARLSPLQYNHINFFGRYAFTRPPAPGTRPLRDPNAPEETDHGGLTVPRPTPSPCATANFRSDTPQRPYGAAPCGGVGVTVIRRSRTSTQSSPRPGVWARWAHGWRRLWTCSSRAAPVRRPSPKGSSWTMSFQWRRWRLAVPRRRADAPVPGLFSPWSMACWPASAASTSARTRS